MDRRRRQRLPSPSSVDPRDLWGRLYQFLEALEVLQYSKTTVKAHRFNLALFVRWCEERSLLRPTDVTRPILERYRRHLFHYRKSNGHRLSPHSQHSRVGSLRAFFKWLTRQGVVLYNPASELEMPRCEHRLPRDILTLSEVEAVLSQPDVRTTYGLRDRAILETFYSTGIRRTELVELGLYDLDLERRVLFVRLGKGKKDRYLPVGRRAAQWLDSYLLKARPELVSGEDPGALFLSYAGAALSPGWLTHHVSRYIQAAGVGKSGSCHLFRHTLATLMLENGADIRFIQHMLGHAKLTTTEIYTHVSIKKLQEIHEQTHPASRPAEARGERGDDGSLVSREALFAELDAEAAEELDDAQLSFEGLL